MSDDFPFDGSTSFPGVQFAFFTVEGGQWVLRGNTVADVSRHLDDLLAAVDETEGPGLLSTVQQLKAAGVLKEGMSKPVNTGGNAAAAPAGGFPDWVVSEATKALGRVPGDGDIKTGIAKTGPKAGQAWYAVEVNGQRNWLNKPRG